MRLQVAVHDLCLGVRNGERFGLLGPNGAGAHPISNTSSACQKQGRNTSSSCAACFWRLS